MPYETLRFIHAARVSVAHPLSDTGMIAAELRDLTRRATTQALRNLVAASIEQDIDFLLLTGDTLHQSDFSIQARVELRRGFEQLDDAGIQVFLVPGANDPGTLWNEFPDLPSNVTVFRPESDDPVAVLRDGSVIASIRALSWRQSWFAWDDEEPHADRTQRRPKEADEVESLFEPPQPRSRTRIEASGDPELDDPDLDGNELLTDDEPTGSATPARREIRRVNSPADLRPNHFAIAIVRDDVDQPGLDPQADYLAVVGGRERMTSKGSDWLMHFPGSTQGLSPNEPGLHGCSLVDLDSDGVIRCRFLPTAPVRWETIELPIDADTTFQQLVNRAQAACRELCGVTPTPAEPRRSNALDEVSDEFGDDESGDELVGETSTDEVTHDLAAISETLHAQACFLRWTIRGHGPLFEALSGEPMQTELIEWLDTDVHWPLEVPRLHQFRLIAAEPVVTREESDDDNEQLDVPTEYFWRVDQAHAVGASAWSDLGGNSEVERELFARLEAASLNCDASVVFSLARRRGWKWFRGVNS
ncbi:MAG: exonuclease SbcCD subunit D [Planctomycetaceae bacterium]